jgi:serine/threonine protein phosphatase PrpC
MSDERLVKVTKAHGRLEGLSEALVNDVLSNKKITRDNISLIVIDLNRLFKNGFDQRVE